MYKIDDLGSTFASLPPNLQTTENACFGYALDRQIKKLLLLANQLTVWSNLDNVNPKYYDYLAMCVRAPYYKSEYSNKKKLELIKTAIMSYRYAGTRTSVDQLTDILFENASFVPWYEYGGEPYHFSVKVYDKLTEDAEKMMGDVLKKVKAARSVLDKISIYREAADKVYMGGQYFPSYKPAPVIDNMMGR